MKQSDEKESLQDNKNEMFLEVVVTAFIAVVLMALIIKVLFF